MSFKSLGMSTEFPSFKLSLSKGYCTLISARLESHFLYSYLYKSIIDENGII